MRRDKHQVTVPSQTVTSVEALIDGAQAEIDPFAIAVAPETSRHMERLGEKGMIFIDKAYTLGGINPKCIPKNMDWQKFVVDYHDVKNLSRIRMKAKKLYDTIDGIVEIAGSESMGGAREFYHGAQDAAKDEVPGAEDVVNQMKTRYPQHSGGHKKDEKEETE